MACPMHTPRQWIFIGFLALSVICPLAVRAGEIHVPGDYLTLQEAIDAALPGNVILVDPGTYGGPLNTNLDFGGKDLELRSTDGPDVTIIDCQPSNRRGLFFHNGETASAIVDGFTITKSLFPRGGGIRFMNNASPTIRNCVLSEASPFLWTVFPLF